MPCLLPVVVGGWGLVLGVSPVWVSLHACASDNQALRVGLGTGPPAMGIDLGAGEIQPVYQQCGHAGCGMAWHCAGTRVERGWQCRACTLPVFVVGSLWVSAPEPEQQSMYLTGVCELLAVSRTALT